MEWQKMEQQDSHAPQRRKVLWRMSMQAVKNFDSSIIPRPGVGNNRGSCSGLQQRPVPCSSCRLMNMAWGRMAFAPTRLRRWSPGFSRSAAVHRLKPGLRERCPDYFRKRHQPGRLGQRPDGCFKVHQPEQYAADMVYHGSRRSAGVRHPWQRRHTNGYPDHGTGRL